MTNVSVIVPVYNDPDGLRTTLDSLTRQRFPNSKFKVIVVDNASTDDTLDVAKTYEQEYCELITVTQETEIQGSYAARNTGIEKSNNNVLAFIDADCKAHPDWVATGLQVLRNPGVDLVGGNVVFEMSDNPSVAEIYDSAFSMQTEQLITERNCTVTANLFCSRDVIETIGIFSEEFESGGDIAWTSKATANGFSLVYAEDVIVSHPTRDLPGLIKKKKRIGRGKSQKHPFKRQLIPTIVDFLPPSPLRIINQVNQAGIPPLDSRRIVGVWIVSWLCKVSINVGRVSYYLNDTT